MNDDVEVCDGDMLAVKILRTSLSHFSNRSEYQNHHMIERRAGGGGGGSGGKRSRFKQWAEKEFRNLLRAHRVGANVPLPICVKNHVIVMEFMGSTEEHIPSPQLSDIKEEELPTQVI